MKSGSGVVLGEYSFGTISPVAYHLSRRTARHEICEYFTTPLKLFGLNRSLDSLKASQIHPEITA